MGRAIYFDTFSGISGDMTLGALLHAGLPLEFLQGELEKLGLNGAYRLEKRLVKQHGISGIKLDVVLSEGEQPQRSLNQIEQLISNSGLTERVKARATAIFRRLGKAEAKVHDIPLEKVHFHEVGAVDAIVDVVGSCIGFEYFEVEEFYCSALPSGTGFVKSEHGLMPVPAPATLELLATAGATFAPAVTLSGGVEYPARLEMVTPTGAAIVATLCRFERPTLKLSGSGYGYGSKEMPWPNALRIWLGESKQFSVVSFQSSILSQRAEENNEAHEQPHPHKHSDNGHNHSHEHLQDEPSRNSSLITGCISPPDEVHHSSLSSSTPGEVSVLETNLDDMTPEGLGFLMEKLLGEGALDVYFTSIQMKKNRPATKLSVVARIEDEERLAALVLRESSSFGLRVSRMQRYIAGREFGEVETTAGTARVKRKLLDGEIIEVVPEYESIAALARQTGRPWREIYDEVQRAAGKSPHLERQ